MPGQGRRAAQGAPGAVSVRSGLCVTANPGLPGTCVRRKLIVKHSDVVDANMAGRFIATYPSPSKAYTALVQVVVSLAESLW